MAEPTEADKAKAREYVAAACAEEGQLWFEDETGEAALASVIARVIADEREAMRERCERIVARTPKYLGDSAADRIERAIECIQKNVGGEP